MRACVCVCVQSIIITIVCNLLLRFFIALNFVLKLEPQPLSLLKLHLLDVPDGVPTYRYREENTGI